MYVVPEANGAAGVNVAVVPDDATVPATPATPPSGLRVNVVVVMDEARMASENIADTVVLRSTPLAKAGGAVEVTEGAFRSKSTPPSLSQEAIKGARIASAPTKRAQ